MERASTTASVLHAEVDSYTSVTVLDSCSCSLSSSPCSTVTFADTPSSSPSSSSQYQAPAKTTTAPLPPSRQETHDDENGQSYRSYTSLFMNALGYLYNYSSGNLNSPTDSYTPSQHSPYSPTSSPKKLKHHRGTNVKLTHYKLLKRDGARSICSHRQGMSLEFIHGNSPLRKSTTMIAEIYNTNKYQYENDAQVFLDCRIEQEVEKSECEDRFRRKSLVLRAMEMGLSSVVIVSKKTFGGWVGAVMRASGVDLDVGWCDDGISSGSRRFNMDARQGVLL